MFAPPVFSRIDEQNLAFFGSFVDLQMTIQDFIGIVEDSDQDR